MRRCFHLLAIPADLCEQPGGPAPKNQTHPVAVRGKEVRRAKAGGGEGGACAFSETASLTPLTNHLLRYVSVNRAPHAEMKSSLCGNVILYGMPSHESCKVHAEFAQLGRNIILGHDPCLPKKLKFPCRMRSPVHCGISTSVAESRKIKSTTTQDIEGNACHELFAWYCRCNGETIEALASTNVMLRNMCFFESHAPSDGCPFNSWKFQFVSFWRSTYHSKRIVCSRYLVEEHVALFSYGQAEHNQTVDAIYI